MASIYFLVEGETEERFFKEIVKDYYKGKHFISCSLMPQGKRKGGTIDYNQTKKELSRFFYSGKHFDKIILIQDYYRLGKTMKEHIGGNLNLDKIIFSIQERLEKDVNNPKFHFRLQIHEFEAYLFTNPDFVASYFDDNKILQKIEKILEEFDGNPELINNRFDTKPSKRLDEMTQNKFQKRIDGITIVKNVGIDNIRKKCKYFNELFNLIDYLPAS